MTLPSYEPRPPPGKKSLVGSYPYARWILLALIVYSVVRLYGVGGSNTKRGNNSPLEPSNGIHNGLSKSSVPTISLLSGLEMPAIGYGTCCRASARGDAIYKSTGLYLKLGGRLIDTAMAYRNHDEIGRAVKESGVPRSEIWITSKVAPGKVSSYHACLVAVDEILTELDTTYLDLLLIHTPKLGKDPTIELWKCLIEAKRLGKTKSIGVSNFNRGEIEDIASATGELPEANEIQLHPWSSTSWKELAKWQNENTIATIAYTSLGGSRFDSSGGSPSWPPVVSKLAKKYGATEAQILLKWALQNDLAVIPGSGSKKHIKENLLLSPAFDLTRDELLDIENAQVPHGWWDPKRGHQKYLEEEASLPWVKRKNG
ncbi:hypothetical protein HJC23_002866 [Cyclotella cryptica]|uniref:NADP-dependent oxidoreductase domain-containing protein n=1 Tax=Cyclotella cryptica TaxID=29204 RepID=A0ABD3PJW5_9STRA|eukprot:CCRYP_013804-RA/>CCRYP_013804-RA protein AED:0.16 eAED:0.16 QI:0/-1/0/1/-1/1/1/0/371